jgi:hypothetical protein
LQIEIIKAWSAISEFFLVIAKIYARDWQCGFPPKNCVPSAALDDEVSVWCIILMADLGYKVDPPAFARPWILARLTCCASHAALQKFSGVCPPHFSKSLINKMLIDDWYSIFKDQWKLLYSANSDSL